MNQLKWSDEHQKFFSSWPKSRYSPYPMVSESIKAFQRYRVHKLFLRKFNNIFKNLNFWFFFHRTNFPRVIILGPKYQKDAFRGDWVGKKTKCGGGAGGGGGGGSGIIANAISIPPYGGCLISLRVWAMLAYMYVQHAMLSTMSTSMAGWNPMPSTLSVYIQIGLG